MDFQDVITMALLYFPHLLTSIASKKKQTKKKKNFSCGCYSSHESISSRIYKRHLSRSQFHPLTLVGSVHGLVQDHRHKKEKKKKKKKKEAAGSATANKVWGHGGDSSPSLNSRKTERSCCVLPQDSLL